MYPVAVAASLNRSNDIDFSKMQDGSDVTGILGVKLWKIPVAGGYGFNSGRSKGSFPTHLVACRKQGFLFLALHQNLWVNFGSGSLPSA